MYLRGLTLMLNIFKYRNLNTMENGFFFIYTVELIYYHPSHICRQDVKEQGLKNNGFNNYNFSVRRHCKETE